MVDPNSTKGKSQTLSEADCLKPGNLGSLAFPEVPRAETAWLIEREDGMYLGESTAKGLPRLGFVSGPDNALRFARKEDAEAVLRMDLAYGFRRGDYAMSVTEHEWVAASTQPA